MQGRLATAAALLLLFLPQSPSSTGIDPITRYVRAQMDWRLIPGVAYAVTRRGRIVSQGSLGVADVEDGVPVIPETVFHLGSVGKPFTAAAVLRLVEDGRLSLRDSIATHIPGAPAAWRPITIQHLLSHTSGLQDYDDALDRARDYTDAELAAIVAAQPRAARPGERFRYSNAGYLLLGMIYGRASGTHLGDALMRDVFKPLRMDATAMLGRLPSAPLHLATGYRLVNGKPERAGRVSRSLNSTGDGSLVSTVGDVVSWMNHLDASRAGTTGWGVATHRGHRIVEHGGSWQGFGAHVARYADDGVSVVVLTNLTGIGNTAGVIAHKIARYFVPALRDAEWPTHTPVRVSAARLERYTGEYRLGDATLRVVREGDVLVLTAGGRRGRARMIATSLTEFRIEADTIRLRFADTPAGAALYVRDTTEQRATRIR